MRGYLLLVLTIVIFSANMLVGKAINELPPFTISFGRVFIAFLVMLPIGWHQAWRERVTLRREWRAVLALALTGVTFFSAFIYAALQFTSPANVAILETGIPVVTVLLGFLFFGERLSRLQWLGVVLAVGGALWVITGGSIATLGAVNWNVGDLIMIAAILTWVGYSLLVKQHIARIPRYGGLLVMLAIANLTLLPLALLETAFVGLPDLSRPDLLGGLLYIGIFPSVIALLLYNRAIEEVGASRAALFLTLLPVFTMAGAYLFLGEPASLVQIIGALVVIAGVLLITTPTRSPGSQPAGR